MKSRSLLFAKVHDKELYVYKGWNPKWKFRTQRRPITMWYVWPANAQTCLRIRAVWSETLLALIFYECLSYWPNIIWSRKLKRWLHIGLVAFTPHWWRQSYDTATARGRVNISCCKITSNPVWHNWGNKTALHFLQTAKGALWLGGRVLDLRPRSCGSKLALCPRSLLSTWST